jgi:imidazolonepropionase-like amidohydrolase
MTHERWALRLRSMPFLWCALLLGGWGGPLLGQETTLVLRGARLLTVSHGIMEEGVLVLKDGLITAVGVDVPIPPGAEVLEMRGKTVMPGLIDAFTNLGAADYPSYGRDDDEATDPVTPHLRMLDALDPDNRFIPLARSAGVTAVLCAPADGNLFTGQSALVRLAGAKAEAMVVRAPVGVHVSLGEAAKLRYGEKNRMPSTRMGAAALLRQTLVDAQAYADRLARHEKELAEFKAAGRAEGRREPAPPARDLKLEALLPALGGEMPLIVSADRYDDIQTALRIADEFQLRIILNHGAEAHRMAGDLAGRGIPVLWGPVGTEYRKPEAKGATPATPRHLADAGVAFAFQTGSVENLTGLLDQARAAMAHGLSYEDALAGLTLRPAQILGAEDRMGSLEVGKAADLVVFDGDPLDALSRVEVVFIGGTRYRPLFRP